MPATIQQVRRRIIQRGGPDAARLLRFADLLFSKTDQGLFETFGSESLHAIAVEGLSFLANRKGDDIMVKVYNPSHQVNGWEGPYTVIALLLEDRPFIVDSVQAELRRQERRLHHLLHPILSVVRSDDGEIVALGSRRQEGVKEALELYFIERLEEPEGCKRLEEAVRRVLSDVVLATRDYPLMRERVPVLSDYLRQLREVSAQGRLHDRAEELEEYAAFMDWLDNDNFVYLGYREYDIVESGKTRYLKLTEGSGLGLLSKVGESAYREPVPIDELPAGLRERVIGGRVLTVTKTNAESTVHRPARMDYIGIKTLSDRWQVQGEQRFVGLFTSRALSAPAEEIPILRRKLRQVHELDGANPGSYDFKQIHSAFNSMPREELFWSDAAQIHKDIQTIIGLVQEGGVRLSLRNDPLDRGLAVMVIMPRDRFDTRVRRTIQEHLREKLEAHHADYQLAMGEDEAQVRLHFFFITQLKHEQVDARALEHEVTELTRTWEDHVTERLAASAGEREGRRLAKAYLQALDERYKADISADAALRDIQFLERMGAENYLIDILNPAEDPRGEGATQLKIYHRNHTLVLSEILPTLENLGFKVLEQISYVALPATGLRGIDVFRVQDASDTPIDVTPDWTRLTDALNDLLDGVAENDRLNRLVLYAGLSIRQVALLRGYQMYLSQLSSVTSRSFITETLLRHPQSAALLYRFFATRFDPDLGGDREEAMEEARDAFLDNLSQVSSLAEDQTLRGLFDLLEASVRTNYFLGRDYISFKIASAQVAAMPEPRPQFEIGVIAPGIEGVHLRAGPIARGGIRWSDRPDDFRTEILGLMKTQTTKNAVVVPVGSKGGFVLKRAPAAREALRDYVQEQYQIFIRGLLDLTDNRIADRPVHPEGLVRYDGPDPYLVVAADKGTATFSDLSNGIAAEYGFWLGDAFASGGSQGYDHKEEGITSRGAWECVKRHFRELGLNVLKTPFTVVGIGDMSGDVFGNGMLCSDRIRLQAAFNHLHIFLDPDPDPEAGYAERRRLFDLPSSSWSDYDPSVISAGGGVFERSAKAIELSPQVRSMLGVEEEVLSGQDLIRAILTMEVDLLWNGGIGTYIKASTERHGDVGDASNDLVRVDANRLRARVVGEGGNLGLTQPARIEYARAGGRINTDAIDNSAGVDLSDHEVNIKILLQAQVGSGELSMPQRNRLLKEMTDEVSMLVLRNNYYQSLALSLAEKRSREDPLLLYSLIEYLAERGGLNPLVEDLPTRRQILMRSRSGEGLTRPELAVLMAYVKMGLYRRLLETDFPDEPRFLHYLITYFPEALQERFAADILAHPLQREIIATQLTNTVVDILGLTFVHRTIRDTGATPVEIIRAALVALEILEVRGFLTEIFALDHKIAAEAQYEAIRELVTAVEGIVKWMLLNDLSGQDVAEFVAAFRRPLVGLRKGLEDLLPGSERRRFGRVLAHFKKLGFSKRLSAEIASFDYLPTCVGVIEVSRGAGVPLTEAAHHLFRLGERLSLGWLRDGLGEIQTENKWETASLEGLVMDLRRAQRDLALSYVRASNGKRLGVNAFLDRYKNLLHRYDQALAEVREQDLLDLTSGGVLVRLLAQATRD